MSKATPAIDGLRLRLSSVRSVDYSQAKNIWVAAIDPNAPAGSDPSHPAFYLPGQEESGNYRPVFAPGP
jgi:hypothetical protein